MTLCVVGTRNSICSVARSAAAKAEWLKKLVKNAAPKLNRIGDIVSITTESLKPNGNRITLQYTGTDIAKDLPRIERVLDVSFDKSHDPCYIADTKLGRLKLHIVLDCELYQLLKMTA